MENKKQNESRELSAQELASISGGIAKGEFYPTETESNPSGYPIDKKYNDLFEVLTKKLENIKLPYWNDNKPGDLKPL